MASESTAGEQLSEMVELHEQARRNETRLDWLAALVD
jgi:hypothetical protein